MWRPWAETPSPQVKRIGDLSAKLQRSEHLLLSDAMKRLAIWWAVISIIVWIPVLVIPTLQMQYLTIGIWSGTVTAALLVAFLVWYLFRVNKITLEERSKKADMGG